MNEDAEKKDLDELLTIDELSKRCGLAPTFLRCGVEAGCPTVDGRLSHGTFVCWLTEHYAEFRAQMGLEALPSTSHLGKREKARQDIVNVMLTITHFIAMRSPDPRMQQAARSAEHQFLQMTDQDPDDEDDEDDAEENRLR